MRTRSFAPAFVVTALGGGALADGPPAPRPSGNLTSGRLGAGARLPASRAVDPITLHADRSCTQAAEPCPPGGCAPDARQIEVRCPPPALSADARPGPAAAGPDGTCRAFVSYSCGPTDCGDVPCPPVSCNPPPPQLEAVPCPGEGTVAQLRPVATPLPDGGRIEPLLNGECEYVPQVPADFRCAEGATCNPPAPEVRPCPSPQALRNLVKPPEPGLKR